MNRFASVTRPLMWFTALLFAALTAGCGGGGGGSPILGGGGAANPALAAAAAAAAAGIIPGAVCTIASGPTIPTVTSSDPTSGNQFVTTSTTGSAGKLISATFSLAMDPTTITSTSFTLTQMDANGVIVALVTPTGQPTYNTSTRVATLTVPTLLAGTNYKVIITTAVKSLAGTPISCSYAWSFKTATPAAAGAAPVNLGLATPFAIAAAAGVTTAGGISTVNGNVVLEPTATCNAFNVDAAGGIGTCGGIFVPTINGTVISHFYDPTNSRAAIMADLINAYHSIAPLNQAGTLAGATSLGCDTIGTGGGAGGGIGCATNATIPPGVYIALNSSIGVTGTLTLDAGGNSDAVFIFQTKTPSTLTTAAGAIGVPASQIVLINGAKASNVWWQVGSSATIGVGSIFNGNVLADTSVTLNAGSTSCGRMLAGAVTASGAITLGNTTAGTIVSVPGSPGAPAGCL